MTVLALGGACRSTTGPAEWVQTLEIAETRVPCTGSFPQLCLQVRERADQPYQLFYDGIAGFTYEEGTHYVIRVAVRTIANPPPDGSSRAYRLLEILERRP